MSTADLSSSFMLSLALLIARLATITIEKREKNE